MSTAKVTISSDSVPMEAEQLPPSEIPASAASSKLPSEMRKLFIWLLWGDFLLVLMEQVMPSLFPLMLKDHGASNQQIGLIMGTLPTVIGLFLGPVLSYKSDNCRSALGRRRPFMIFSIPFIMAALCAFPFASALTEYLMRIGWIRPALTAVPVAPLLVVLAVLFSLYTIFNTVCASAYSWLLVDVVLQSHMGRFMSLLRIFSLVGAFVFNYFLLGLAGTHSKEMFFGIALAYAVGFGLMSWKVRERPLPPPPPPREKKAFWMPAGDFLVTCFSNPYYLWVYTAFLVYAWSTLAGNLFAVVFMRDTLGMDLDTLGKVRAWVTTLVIPVSYFMGSLIDRWKPQNAIVSAVLLYAAGNLACFFFVHGQVSFFVWTFLTNIAGFYWGVTYTAYIANTFPQKDYAQLTTAMGLVMGLLGAMAMSPVCGWFFDLIGSNYRYMYLWQFVFLLGCAAIFWWLRVLWIRQGGPDNYRAS